MGMAYESISNLGQTAFGNVSNSSPSYISQHNGAKLILGLILSSGPSAAQQSLARTCSPSTYLTRAMEVRNYT